MNLNYGQFSVLKFLLRCLFFNASLNSLVCVWIHIGTKCMEILISLSMIKKYIQSFNAEKIYKNHHKSDMVVLLVEATEFYDIYVICLIISLFIPCIRQWQDNSLESNYCKGASLKIRI